MTWMSSFGLTSPIPMWYVEAKERWAQAPSDWGVGRAGVPSPRAFLPPIWSQEEAQKDKTSVIKNTDSPGEKWAAGAPIPCRKNMRP